MDDRMEGGMGRGIRGGTDGRLDGRVGDIFVEKMT